MPRKHDSYSLYLEHARLRQAESASESALDPVNLHAMKSAALDVDIARELLRRHMRQYPSQRLALVMSALDRAAGELAPTHVLSVPVIEDWTAAEMQAREA